MPASMPLQPEPVLSPQEWADAVRTQRIDRLLPDSEASFTGLSLRPKNVRFATQNKGEKVFILLRRHIITNAGWIFNAVIFSAMLPAVFAILRVFGFDLALALGYKLSVLLVLSWYSVIFTNALRHFVDWYYNLYLVTNQRVLDYDFRPFVSRGVNELGLENIETVREESVGVVASLFNYGRVSVFSAADKNVLSFDEVPRPTFVRDKISDLADIVRSSRYEP